MKPSSQNQMMPVRYFVPYGRARGKQKARCCQCHITLGKWDGITSKGRSVPIFTLRPGCHVVAFSSVLLEGELAKTLTPICILNLYLDIDYDCVLRTKCHITHGAPSLLLGSGHLKKGEVRILVDSALCCDCDASVLSGRQPLKN